MFFRAILTAMETIVFGLFGLIVGSFLNVVVIRRGAKSLGGRSACVSCVAPIEWYDNIPVVSWLLLRGRCRSCGSGISAQYPLVEVLTAALFAIIGTAPESLGVRLVALPVLAILICIAVYDTRHTIIPDAWVYLFAGAALLFQFSAASAAGYSTALVLLSGPIAAFPLYALWFVSGGRWMGFGDVKLALGIGWLLGPVWGVISVFFAFTIGAVITIGVLLPLPAVVRFLRKQGIARLSNMPQHFTMKSEVPFGPFLIASCICIWFSILYHIPLPL